MAANGKEGLVLYDAVRPEIVITDLYMPTKGGLETIIELRRRSPHLPIIALSGTGAAEKMLAIAQKFGAFAILHKPFTPEELVAVVQKAVDAKA